MRLQVVPLMLVAALASSRLDAVTIPQTNAPQDVAAIRAIETALHTATSSAALIGHYAADAAMIDPYDAGVSEGTGPIRARLDEQLAGVRSRTPDFRQMDIVATNTFACAASQVRETAVTKDGRTITTSLRQLDAFQKIGGKWAIVQQHASLPNDQKSGRAVADTAPAAEMPAVWFPASAPARAIDAAQARREIYDWMLTGTHTTTADQMMDWYANDSTIILYDAFAPGYMRGPKSIRDYYAPMMDGFESVDTVFPKFVAKSDGILGGEIDTQVLTVKTASGETNVYRLRQNDCVIRIGGKWKTFFEHISLPAGKDTGSAQDGRS